MHFSEQEITLAKRLKQLGLVWEPQAGNYVYDPTEFCQQPSPFQERVYFILNYNYFMKAVGGVGIDLRKSWCGCPPGVMPGTSSAAWVSTTTRSPHTCNNSRRSSRELNDSRCTQLIELLLRSLCLSHCTVTLGDTAPRLTRANGSRASIRGKRGQAPAGVVECRSRKDAIQVSCRRRIECRGGDQDRCEFRDSLLAGGCIVRCTSSLAVAVGERLSPATVPVDMQTGCRRTARGEMLNRRSLAPRRPAQQPHV